MLTAPHAFCEATSGLLTAQGSFCAITSGGLSTQHGFCATTRASPTARHACIQMTRGLRDAPRHHLIAYHSLKSSKFFCSIHVRPSKSYLFFETFTAYCLVICGKVVSLHLLYSRRADFFDARSGKPMTQDVGAATGREHYILKMRR